MRSDPALCVWLKLVLQIACGVPGVVSAQRLELAHVLTLPDGGEIVDVSPDGRTLATTSASGVRLFELDDDLNPTPRANIDLSATFATVGQGVRAVSSVALDPLRRGFGVAAVIPQDNGSRRGCVVFFSLANGEVIRAIEAGYHPDSLLFSPDGGRLFVVNEGEFVRQGDDPPGSISMVDLQEVHGVDSLRAARFDGDHPLTRRHLARGVDLATLRVADEDGTPRYRQAEPEYAAFHAGLLYVGFQENNAVGVFDPQRRQWRALWSLGTVPITIDASDRNGVAIDTRVNALPMPDTLAVFETKGRVVIVTADEGDFRVDGMDARRMDEFLGASPQSSIDPQALSDPKQLGRLQVSAPDSDTDHDGQIDRLVVAGSRGISLWDGGTGQRLGGTGSLERWLAEQDSDRHNADAKSSDFKPDTRSDNKGPEPEGLAVLKISDGRVLAAVGMERQNGVVLIDVTDPTHPRPLAYRNDFGLGVRAPESLRWGTVPGQIQPVLFVGYEGDKAGNGCAVASYRLMGND